MKGQGGGGPARGGGKNKSGGGNVKIVKTKPRRTKEIEEHVITLRQALFTPSGKDKDVTEGIAPAFMKFNRNDLDLVIEFSPKLSKQDVEWAFDITKASMEARYDASGYGWDDEEKERELKEQGARFLLVRERNSDSSPGKLAAFAHFRFSVEGEVMDVMVGQPSLFLWDIHVEPNMQRKGLGKHLLMVLELIARRECMKSISVPVQLGDDITQSWMAKCRGYSPNENLLDLMNFDSDLEGFEVYAKALPPPVARAQAVESSASSSSSCSKVAPSSSPCEDVPIPSPPAQSSSPLCHTAAVAAPPQAPCEDTSAVNSTVEEENDNDDQEDDEECDDGEVNLNDIDEFAMVEELKKMYLDKTGTEASAQEIEQWRITLREAKHTSAADEESSSNST